MSLLFEVRKASRGLLDLSRLTPKMCVFFFNYCYSRRSTRRRREPSFGRKRKRVRVRACVCVCEGGGDGMSLSVTHAAQHSTTQTHTCIATGGMRTGPRPSMPSTASPTRGRTCAGPCSSSACERQQRRHRRLWPSSTPCPPSLQRWPAFPFPFFGGRGRGEEMERGGAVMRELG